MRSILFYAWLGFTWAQYTPLGEVQNDDSTDTTKAYTLDNGMEIVLVSNQEYGKISVALHVKHTHKSGSGEACADLVSQAFADRAENVAAYAMVASTMFRMDFEESTIKKSLKALAKALPSPSKKVQRSKKASTSDIRRLLEQILARESLTTHPYSYNPKGSCHKNYYASNMRLVVVSSMKQQDLINLVSRSFRRVPRKKSRQPLASPFNSTHTGKIFILENNLAACHLQFQTEFIPEAYQLKYLLSGKLRNSLTSLGYNLVTYIQRVSPRHVLLNMYFVQRKETNLHQYFVANTFFQYIRFLNRTSLDDEHVHPKDLIGTTTSSKSQITADFSIRSLFLQPSQAYEATGLYSPFNNTAFSALLNSLTPQNARLAYTIPKFTKVEIEIAPITKSNYHLGRINPKAFQYNLLSEKELLIPKPHEIFHHTYINEYITHDMKSA
ncbi:hypothetical protein DSO57_1038317 [Entomophthora muscae]|uniref:Uncharacterized protein n=2 Tax=Entomophthora muscae TaxID=34485 RepID=A0ACC2SEF7_9FUNG|nr:hypothetical protein DSO57_1029660 [Entomophthora muscae]KAJ9063688.1 hypothetical protein DSO57_1038317 [Entomophthora muscae]